MKNEINEILISIINSTTQAKEFVLSETPDVINQLLLWGITEGVIGFFMIIFFGWVGFKSASYFIKKQIDEFFICMYIIVYTLFYICVVVEGFISIIAAIKIMVAPKIYLIEYAASLVN